MTFLHIGDQGKTTANMKNSVTFSAIPSFAAYQLEACDSSSPEIVFESAIPEPARHPTAAPGEAPWMRHSRYCLSTGRKAAFITTAGESGSLFFGQAAHFRGVYFFSQSPKDNSFYRYAVRIRQIFRYDLNSCLDHHYQAARQLP